MPEHEGPVADLRGDLSPARGRRRRIVVAGDPDPVPPLLQGRHQGAVAGLHALGTAGVVEGIAQRDHAGGIVAHHRLVQAGERLAGVVGRQELAGAGRVGRALLQVEIGHDQRPVLRQPEATAEVEHQGLAREKQGGVLVSLLESQAGRQDRILGVVGEGRIGGQDRASWRSSASASARISSAPSP